MISRLSSVLLALVASLALGSSVRGQCSGDINGDGFVSAEDLAAVLFSWGPCAQCAADVDGDGMVAATDVAIVIGDWGACEPYISAISPNVGPPSGGTTITITGRYLGEVHTVLIGGVPATRLSSPGPDTLTAVTPAGTSGIAALIVIGPNGSASLESGFVYRATLVPDWATLVEEIPDPAIVPAESARMAIEETGLAWRVRDNASQIEMLLIPPGTFNMGSNSVPPIHQVSITRPLYLGRYEVKQSEWQAVMGGNPSYFRAPSYPNTADHPVEQVSWNMIQGFNAATGLRLPTEAEWEYAYRAGTTTDFHAFAGYPSGTNDVSLLHLIAWLDSNSNAQSHAVGLKLPNGFGLHDIAGNVHEWVNDWYSSTYYQSSPPTDPPGPQSGQYRVLRGGSWWVNYTECRAASRRLGSPGVIHHSLGFRAAKTPFPEPEITDVVPRSGPTLGGTAISLVGSGFHPPVTVRVGGVEATNVKIVSSSLVVAMTPPGAAGFADLDLTTNWGTSVLEDAFNYSPLDWATVLEQTPDPAVVTNAAYRDAISATGLPWRVQHSQSQIEMLLVPSGTFQMGCSASNQHACLGHETPVHAVTLTNPFYLGRYEVTQAQWTAIMGSNPAHFVAGNGYPGSSSRPVEAISWNMIQGFNAATGLRLPTEAEWEYAYRAGTSTAFHSFPGHPNGTSDYTLLGNIAWFSGNNGASGTPSYGTKVVGQKQGNALGLHDMSGNVWEWVNDLYSSTYYQVSPLFNPPGPSAGSFRVVRGSSWSAYAGNTWRASERDCYTQAYKDFDVGFRVARNP